jgi:DNA-binding response OmpR family regulator
MMLKKSWASCPYCGAAGAAEAAGPALESAEPKRAAEGGRSAATPAAGVVEPPRILVVDDYADVRMLVRIALQSGGSPLAIREAESGAEALAMIDAERPHLILLDLMMPGMDGYEVCRRLRSNLKTAFIPILMLTALADAQSKSLGFLAGTDDYLVKPFETAELRSRVRWLLQRSYRLASDTARPAVEPRAVDSIQGGVR